MSKRKSTPTKHGPYRKPRADVFTVLLIVALLAIIIGCLFVYFEVADYPDQPPWSGGPSARLAPAEFAPDRTPLQPSPAEQGRIVSHRFSYPHFG